MAPRAVTGLVQFGAFDRLTLSDDETYDSRFIPSVPIVNIPPLTDAALRDDAEPDGWKRYHKGHACRSGFITIDYELPPFGIGDVLTIGQLETLKAIAHRNKVLNDSGINLPVPIKTSRETETRSLERCITECNSTPGKAYNYYWPAFSYAYSYEPVPKQGEILSGKFKSHNWFLGTAWDYARAAWLNKYDSRFISLKEQGHTSYTAPALTSSPGPWEGTANKCCSNFVNVGSYAIYVSRTEVQNYNKFGNVFPMVQF